MFYIPSVNAFECQQHTEGTFVRYDAEYRWFNVFNAGSRDAYMNRYNINYKNPEFIDAGSKFGWTKKLKDSSYRVPKNTSMKVYETGEKGNRIVKHPDIRTNATKSSHDFIIAYKTGYDYANTQNDKSDDKSDTHCKYYSVTWCGDGVVDKKYEECDPKVKGMENTCSPKTCKYTETISFNKATAWETTQERKEDIYFINSELNIGARNALLSKNKLDGNYNLSLKIKPSWGGGPGSTNSDGTAWSERIYLGFYQSSLSNKTMLKPNMDHILFRLDSCPSKGALPTKHTIAGNLLIKNIETNNNACLVPKKYNNIEPLANSTISK